MNDNLTNKLVAWLTLLSGLSISAVAVYYSVAGLIAIFSAAVIPIVVMGVTLEVSKLVATVWLKQNWNIAPFSIKAYLISAVVMLMLITSMGIFGFLSKAHADRSLVTGDVQAKITVYDEQIRFNQESIQNEKDNIVAARSALSQMDAQVSARLDRGSSEIGAERSVQIRRQQARERAELQKDIERAQNEIKRLNEENSKINIERAPIAAELRQVEAEVGPIKYIATFVYGEADQTLLEKAVVWVILLLIVVFDPLAVILLLASQHSFQKLKEQELSKDNKAEPIVQQSEMSPSTTTAETSKINPVDLWNSMIKAAEEESTVTKVDLPPKPQVWKTKVFHPPATTESSTTESATSELVNETAADSVTDVPSSEETSEVTSSTHYVQNEEQKNGGRWKNINRVITEKEYLEAAEKNIEEMVQRVKSGILPFYKVPYEIQEEVKKGLGDAGENNTNNPS